MFDAVYTPRETRLLRDALASGCLVADGVAMFVGQAVEQLKLFTGACCVVGAVMLCCHAVWCAANMRGQHHALPGWHGPAMM